MPDYKPLPILFRKSPDVVATIDFFDSISGVGYKKFFFAGTKDTTSSKYRLVTESTIHSDDENHFFQGASADVDFDIEIGGNGFTIAAEDAITVASFLGDTVILASYIIKHVTSGGTETTLGTILHNSFTGDGGPNKWILKSAHIKLTEKRFSRGEKLRVTYVSSSGSSANSRFYYDPSGIWAQTDETPNYPHVSFVLIPIRVDV